MTIRNNSLNRLSLAVITAGIATPALAEVAGKIIFTSGDVRITGADGTARSAVKGDSILGGDRIRTNGGRLQIRFTDGGYIALQPGTEFSVDQYQFENQPREKTSLLFSLLKGGMRTISGEIGKLVKTNYKVKTPVATIGIRGTEYAAQIEDDHLLVGCDKGAVVVENDNGSITILADQNAEVTGDGQPRQTDTDVDFDSTEPEANDGQSGDNSGNSGKGDGYVAGNDITSIGLVDGIYQAAFSGGNGYFSSFDAVDSRFKDGALIKGKASAAGPSTSTIVEFDVKNGRIYEAGSTATLAWGRWAGNLGSTDTTIIGSSNTTLTQDQGLHYIVGAATPAANFAALSGTYIYSVIGATNPTLDNGSSTPGTLDQPNSNLQATFGASPILTLNIALNIAGEYITASNGTIYFNGSSFSASLNASSTSSTSNLLSAGGAFGSANGFFSGSQAEQAGIAYKINGTNTNISGAVVFGNPTVPTNIINGTGL